MKSWLGKNAIELYSIHNEEKFIVAERLLEPQIIKSIKARLQYEKICILIN